MKKMLLSTCTVAVVCMVVNYAAGQSCCAASTAAKAEKAAPATPYTMIDTAGLAKLLDDKADVVVVDARSGKYDDGRRIGNATQLSPKATEEEIAAALPDKGAKIVAYCSSTKCPASKELAHKLADLGYKNVVKYPDGIKGWTDAGHAVSEPKTE